MRFSASVSIFAILGRSLACTGITGVQLTFFGYPDNSPAGAGIAHDCGRGYTAGGTGTYSNPLTMATSPGELNVCEIVYVPFLEKYVRYEDDCAQCQTDWKKGQRHIDVWTGSSTQNGGNNQIQCENSLTPSQRIGIIRNPSSSYKVDTTALYQSGSCRTSHEYPNNQNSNFC